MKPSALVVFLLFVAGIVHSQPMAGNFFVGGKLARLCHTAGCGKRPEVARRCRTDVLQHLSRTYTRNGGNNTVLVLDSIVAGLSPANRITFQPDAATGHRRQRDSANEHHQFLHGKPLLSGGDLL